MFTLSTLPAEWLGAAPGTIAESLAAALYSTLGADLVYVCLANCGGPAGKISVAQTGPNKTNAAVAEELGPRILEWSSSHRPDELLVLPAPAVGPDADGASGPLRVLTRVLNFGSSSGVIAAGFREDHKPNSLHQLLLDIAATQATTAVQKLSSQVSEREAREEAEALNEVARSLSGELDLQKLVQIATDAARKLTGAKFGAFFYNVINAAGESYYLYTLSGAPREAFEKFGMPRNTAVFAPTFEGKAPVRVHDILQDPRYGKNVPNKGMPQGHLPVRSYLAVSVISRSGEVLGGLFFGHPEPGVFTERAERITLAIAAQSAIAIDNARLFRTAEQEIGQRRAAEEALRSSQERFEIVKEVAQVGFWFCDLPFDKLIWDARVKEHFWLAPDAPVTINTFYERLHPEDRERTRQAIEESIAKKTHYEIEYRTVSDEGGEKWIRAIGNTFYDAAGSPIRFDGVTLDITAEKLAEERLERMVEERTAELQRTIGELEAFSYSVSHDLRSPLRAMQGYAEELLAEASGSLSAEHQGYLQRIRRAASRLDLLTQEVLAYSRLARAEVVIDRVSLQTLTSDIIEQYPNLRAAQSNIHVQAPLHDVMGSEAFLTQAISNLLNNAVKFVKPGVPPRISVRTERMGSFVRLWVEDEGIGIDQKYRGRIFQMFSRIHPESRYEGTGIGLAIVKKSVERLNGCVGFESEPGRGSRFWIELPAASDESDSVPLPNEPRRDKLTTA